MNLLELLTKGKGVLVRNGWCRFASRRIDPDGSASFCATGALLEALRDPELDGIGGIPPGRATVLFQDAKRALDRAVYKYTGGARAMFIELFNDHVAVDKLQILAVYDLAIGEENEIRGRSARDSYRPPYQEVRRVNGPPGNS